MRIDRWPSVLLLGIACSCDNEATVELRSNCLEACLSASADLELEGQLAISGELADALDHARSGLSVYANTAKALTGFVQSVVDLEPGMPSGLSYAGAGLYTAQPSADTRVELRFYLASDTSFGAAGELIDFNLFDVGNYFASLGVTASTTIGLSGISSSVKFTFASAGPGAELLGLAPGVTSPLTVDVSAFSKQLSQVVVQANVIVNHSAETTSIAFALAPGSTAAGALGSGPVALSFGNFSGQNSRFGQVLTMESEALSMRDAGGVYDGTLLFASASPDFAFRMRLTYAASASAEISFACPDATL